MCVFCKIVAGEIPAYKVYEDETVLAFLDIKPVHPGHILVIPKQHVATLEEVSPTTLQALILIVKKLGGVLKEQTNYEGYNVCLNNDPVANQEIPHLHFHIIPRVSSDGLKGWPQQEYAAGEAEEILNKLKR